MIYVEIRMMREEEDVKEKIKKLEKKFKMPYHKYMKSIKDQIEELDERDELEEISEWGRLVQAREKGETYKKLDRIIKPVNPENKKQFAYIKHLLKMLTPERTKLMAFLWDNFGKIKSISELAESLDRDRRAVFEDLQLLKNEKLVEFRNRGRNRIPIPLMKDFAIRYA